MADLLPAQAARLRLRRRDERRRRRARFYAKGLRWDGKLATKIVRPRVEHEESHVYMPRVYRVAL